MKYLALSLPLVLSGCVTLNTDTVTFREDSEPFRTARPCSFAQAKDPTSGLVVGADVLLPEGHEPDYGVHILTNGRIGAVDSFEDVRAENPMAAVLDCRDQGILSPGFINAHEHPAYSYTYPDNELNPGYEHRDEWRLGINGKTQLLSPVPYYYEPGNNGKEAAILLAMELRHLLGGATAIAGTGGVPGAIKNIQRRKPWNDHDRKLYGHQAHVSTFPFSKQALIDLKSECAGESRYELRFTDAKSPADMAYVPHVGEGSKENCAARKEVQRYLERAKRRDRRYSLVHGVAAQEDDYKVMNKSDVTLVWSPRSNLALYGETIDIKGALNYGVRIALATDWSPTGSFSMKEEFKCATKVAKESSLELSNKSLWQMATTNAAYALGLEDSLGAIKPGFWADLVLVESTGSGDPYHGVLIAPDENILVTWVRGKAILLSSLLDMALSKDCVKIPDVAPKICGVFRDFNLSPASFTEHIKEIVPLLGGIENQAPCGEKRL